MVAKKVFVIIGTRPEATKMCPVIHELRKYPERFDTRIIATGQHKEQLYQALAENETIKQKGAVHMTKDVGLFIAYRPS